MHLLIISNMGAFPWGGSEELWWETAMYAHSQGHKVNVVVFENKPVHKKLIVLRKQGIHIDFIGKQEMIIPPLWKRVLGKLFNKPVRLNYKDRFSFIHAMNADFVLLSQGGTTSITYFADLQNFFNAPQVPFAVLNQAHSEFGSLSQDQQSIFLNLFQRATKLFFVSRRNKEVLERQLATKFSRAEIVKNPINLSENNIIAWPNNRVPHFAVVARLDVDAKGQDILLEALSADTWKEREFIVNLFGQGPHEKYLKNIIQFYGLEKKVFLKGQSDNITQVWQDHHVLILPSHSEGMPLSLVEAMVCGRPCLVTDVGDSAVLVKDNETGWVAYTASVKALDEALEKAWAQRSEWQKMGKLAHEDAKRFIDPTPGRTLFEKLMHE